MRVASLQVMPSGSQFLTVMVVVPGETPVRVNNASAGAQPGMGPGPFVFPVGRFSNELVTTDSSAPLAL